MIQEDGEFMYGGDQTFLNNLLYFYSVNNSIQRVLNHFLVSEIESASSYFVFLCVECIVKLTNNETASTTSLFQGISTAASLFTGYFYQESLQYLEDNVFPFVDKIYFSKRQSWEINPTKSHNVDVKANAAELQTICSDMLKRIFATTHHFPQSILFLLHVMRQEIDSKFGPDTADQVLVRNGSSM